MTVRDVTARRNNGGRVRPKGYAPWRPQAAAQVLLEQVNEVLVEYEEHLPLTVRQIFYRLVGVHGYEKSENAYARLADKLVRARRAEVLPFDAIRDDGIVTLRHTAYGGIEDFHDETARRARNYRRDRQAGQLARIELWCEAAGMLHQLNRAAEPFSVPVYSTGGFASLTAVRAIADRALARNVPTVLLHVGDFDPSGESIFESIAEDAALFVATDRVIANLEIHASRVALTAEQVAEHDLPTSPPKATDSRSDRWDGGTCQLEALPPDVLAQIVEDAIFAHMLANPLALELAHEDLDRAELLALPPGESPEAP